MSGFNYRGRRSNRQWRLIATQITYTSMIKDIRERNITAADPGTRRKMREDHANAAKCHVLHLVPNFITVDHEPGDLDSFEYHPQSHEFPAHLPCSPRGSRACPRGEGDVAVNFPRTLFRRRFRASCVVSHRGLDDAFSTRDSSRSVVFADDGLLNIRGIDV